MPWLLLPFSRESASRDDRSDFTAPPRMLINAVRESLKPYLHLSGLSVAKAAEICGFKERDLRSRLRGVGTGLSRGIALLREQKAIRLLLETDTSVTDVGHAVGFEDPASFTRSFKRWTGMSPKEYRRKHGGRPRSGTA